MSYERLTHRTLNGSLSHRCTAGMPKCRGLCVVTFHLVPSAVWEGTSQHVARAMSIVVPSLCVWLEGHFAVRSRVAGTGCVGSPLRLLLLQDPTWRKSTSIIVPTHRGETALAAYVAWTERSSMRTVGRLRERVAEAAHRHTGRGPLPIARIQNRGFLGDSATDVGGSGEVLGRYWGGSSSCPCAPLLAHRLDFVCLRAASRGPLACNLLRWPSSSHLIRLALADDVLCLIGAHAPRRACAGCTIHVCSGFHPKKPPQHYIPAWGYQRRSQTF